MPQQTAPHGSKHGDVEAVKSLRRAIQSTRLGGLRELIRRRRSAKSSGQVHRRVDQSPYFGNYERWPVPWRLAVGEVDGEPVIIILLRESDGAYCSRGRSSRPRRRPYYSHRPTIWHCPWVLSAGDLRRRWPAATKECGSGAYPGSSRNRNREWRQFQEETRCKRKRH